MWRCDNVGGLGEHVKNMWLYLSCFILRLAPSPHKWTDFDDLYVIRRGPNTCKTNPRWPTAAILKIDNRPYLRNGSTYLREIRFDDAYWASEPDRKLKFSTFENPRWRKAAIVKN